MNDTETRVRFEGVEIARPEPGRTAAKATVRWREGESFTGSAEGRDSDLGVLQCAAEATARALEAAVGDRIRLEVVGVETVEAFEAILVIVGLSSQLNSEQRRLVGSCVIKGDPADSAARAVLSATNRLVGSNLIYLR